MLINSYTRKQKLRFEYFNFPEFIISCFYHEYEKNASFWSSVCLSLLILYIIKSQDIFFVYHKGKALASSSWVLRESMSACVNGKVLSSLICWTCVETNWIKLLKAWRNASAAARNSWMSSAVGMLIWVFPSIFFVSEFATLKACSTA